MKIKKEMEEKIVLAIQALIVILAIGWSVRGSVKAQSEQIKKIMKNSARLAYRQQKKDYKRVHKSLKREEKLAKK